ncbi:hypothetical protein CAOG_02028 [Capsaspora owczarzaki ATCC 30864]|uniref:Glutaredoxin-like protein n=1 Tax=Capsaspora owczarzaki (strain ATCC 30864) TaxID=595528 RepID=A0A0D2WLK3_CAPO3|nr:hypothetical protein CAOG_02028 [Capsaspora owczarzaki ATCC 30864]KJE90773.1 hypothetical protein CAOG_002028 [Capsaspora owczarzaki ATCC 30864]|eukprot:XP_004348778.1 hypothetical protein CAOG_02028 [Capsaspora owczarzaki ATCC 30864]
MTVVSLARLTLPTLSRRLLSTTAIPSAAAASSGSAKPLPKLSFFTKDECSLCVPAKEVMYKCQAQIPCTIEFIDITRPENATWFEKYKYDIPVLHINDQFAMQHRFDEAKLMAALKQAAESTS